ncbi:putative sulfate exporter family transporter [uncultured Methanospirillum sp.]|uniref:YeiH family protein n=1 Tax=uncultured Methanospirillum sp. TaxID=262503 RepID=UPI0029C737E9|nr:putative sulfate exporter family transporter [uncultured Methanospirillum sp.]
MQFSIFHTSYSKILIGLIPPLGIGIIAWGVGQIIPILGGPVVAILIGLIVGQIFGLRQEWTDGVAFASKKILQGSIVLLGAGMSLTQVAQIGGSGLPIMIGTLAICLIGGLVIGRAMNIEEQIRSLVTYGTAICGASAIATMSVVIGASGPAIAVSITVIVLYNVLGAVLFPAIGHILGLSQEAFGMWAGTAINDTSSVVAAATVYGAVAATYAVVVKLTRTLAIIPLALFRSWSLNSQIPLEKRHTTVWYKLIPPFLILFIVAAAVQSLGVIPSGWNDPIHFLAHFGTTVAMAAVGMSSSLSAIREAGWKPVALGGILWFLVATSSLILQWMCGNL